ncbi:hypothetical protein [Parerythrobacter lacustris]|uniref:Uncharacterized protein n=1 Tax=Parerythrobacter lacustris TaxID=2969984 RepID=A0ABT1XRH3_9SPHN|nr:hypothetical protein [Parerythrobacter lacustris]MCR2834258.1 hypothetical protein [Parerythrobacter lacustris]
MIEGRTDPPKAPFVRALEAKARRLAEAHGENRLRARRNDAGRWRITALLWPLFAKGR